MDTTGNKEKSTVKRSEVNGDIKNAIRKGSESRNDKNNTKEK